MKSAIYPERESKSLEFKEKLPKFTTLIKTCIGMANGFGGQIVIGIEDATRKIIGIDEHERDRIYDEFPNSLYDSVSPILTPRIWEKSFGEVSVLIIDIPPSPKKPYFLKSEGMPKGVYIRVGSCTRRANDEYIEELIREGRRTTYDEESLHQQLDILSDELLKDFYQQRVTEKRLIADKIIASYSANGDCFSPTVGGTLFFCESPEQYIPEAVVLCTRFKGDEGREILKSEEITGPIDQIAEETYQTLVDWLSDSSVLEGVYMRRKVPIPKPALREAIVNALIHRKYSIPGAVKIAVFDHRCEIFSPGCFPGVVDAKNLGDGTTYLRNPVIAKLARKIGLVEKLGSGIRLILESCRKAKLRRPDFIEGGDFVKVVFYFDPERAPSGDEENEILQFIEMRKSISIGDLMQYLSISRNTATRRLKSLIEAGKIIRRGKGPAVRYYLKGS